MRTRVRPQSCPNEGYAWCVDVYNEHETPTAGWVEIGQYAYFWYANWRANRLSKGCLKERFNVKERFLNRLKFGKE